MFMREVYQPWRSSKNYLTNYRAAAIIIKLQERADFRANGNQPLHSRILTSLERGIDHA
jgi:hypothetical protein